MLGSNDLLCIWGPKIPTCSHRPICSLNGLQYSYRILSIQISRTAATDRKVPKNTPSCWSILFVFKQPWPYFKSHVSAISLNVKISDTKNPMVIEKKLLKLLALNQAIQYHPCVIFKRLQHFLPIELSLKAGQVGMCFIPIHCKIKFWKKYHKISSTASL